MKNLIFVLVICLMAVMNCNRAEAKQITKGNFIYNYQVLKKGVWIKKITPKSDKGISTLKIPENLEGKKVIKLGIGLVKEMGDRKNIFGVYYQSDRGALQPSRLKELEKKVKKIIVPLTVKEIGYYSFLYINGGKTISIPKKFMYPEKSSFLSKINWEKILVATKHITRGSFVYDYKTYKKGIWITKVTPKSDKGIVTLNIPKEIKGKNVIKIGNDIDTVPCNLFGVYYSEDDVLLPTNIKKLQKKIKTIRIPSSVKEIVGGVLMYLEDGKTINIPKLTGKQDGAYRALADYRWKKIILEPNPKYTIKNGYLLSKNGKVFYGYVYRKKRLVIPNSVTTMSDFENLEGIDTLVLPPNLKKWSFCDFGMSCPINMIIAKGNTRFMTKEGSLIDKKTGKLLVGCVKNGVLKIPNEVNRLGDGSFTGIKNLQKVIVPASVKNIYFWLNFTPVTFNENVSVIFEGTTPPEFEGSSFGGIRNATIYMPKGCTQAYKDIWSQHYYDINTTVYET